jgi:hypothetical protein
VQFVIAFSGEPDVRQCYTFVGAEVIADSLFKALGVIELMMKQKKAQDREYPGPEEKQTQFTQQHSLPLKTQKDRDFDPRLWNPFYLTFTHEMKTADDRKHAKMNQVNGPAPWRSVAAIFVRGSSARTSGHTGLDVFSQTNLEHRKAVKFIWILPNESDLRVDYAFLFAQLGANGICNTICVTLHNLLHVI